MKWARVKPSNYKPRGVEEKAQDELCYKDYAKEEHLKKAFEHRSHVWVNHEFSFPFGKEENYKAFQKRYEIFVGGYLYFYDERVRSGVIDHVLYFRWSPYKRTGKFSVTIFLSPAPLRRRVKEESLQIAEPALALETSSVKKGNGVELMERKAQPQAQPMMLMAKSGDTDDDGIDPPPPPPPPPPPMI
jgi:hypothetical protein